MMRGLGCSFSSSRVKSSAESGELISENVSHSCQVLLGDILSMVGGELASEMELEEVVESLKGAPRVRSRL